MTEERTVAGQQIAFSMLVALGDELPCPWARGGAREPMLHLRRDLRHDQIDLTWLAPAHGRVVRDAFELSHKGNNRGVNVEVMPKNSLRETPLNDSRQAACPEIITLLTDFVDINVAFRAQR